MRHTFLLGLSGWRMLGRRLFIPLAVGIFIIMLLGGLQGIKQAFAQNAAPLKEGGAPLRLEVAPLKQIYTSREGVGVQFTLVALRRTQLCLDKDVLSQMQVSISRAGVGRLPLKPLVLQDNRVLFEDPQRVVWLNVGQSMQFRANLKRFEMDQGERWQPGEYTVGATFNLCAQPVNVPGGLPEEPMLGGRWQAAPVGNAVGVEIPIQSVRPAWFMISS